GDFQLVAFDSGIDQAFTVATLVALARDQQRTRFAGSVWRSDLDAGAVVIVAGENLGTLADAQQVGGVDGERRVVAFGDNRAKIGEFALKKLRRNDGVFDEEHHQIALAGKGDRHLFVLVHNDAGDFRHRAGGDHIFARLRETLLDAGGTHRKAETVGCRHR